MSVVSRLIVVHTDVRVSDAVRFGFARQGASVVAAQPGAAGIIGNEPPELVVAGADGSEQATSLLDGLRRETANATRPVPILYLGNGVSREQALAAGASEYLPQPAFLRDVITLGTLLASPRKGTSIIGELGDHFGLYFLVRALLAVGRTGVLTMVRGLRRGELRFYRGELTSAQVGVLHGQAAFHQLLLWTEARFELRDEQVVQRRQIPLDANDLLQDADLFLSEIRTVAAGISPSTVFGQDVARAAAAGLPVQVAALLGLFDGHRTVADVIEDSPYRVFETLRVTQRLAEIGAIRPSVAARTRTPARTALAIEEWLVGDQSAAPLAQRRRDSEPLGPRPGQPASPPQGSRKERRRRRRRRTAPGTRAAASPQRATTARVEVEATDWAAILPSSAPSDGTGMSPVVPATVVAGEIEVGLQAARTTTTEAAVVIREDDVAEPPPREGLEALTDSDQRARIFPAEPPVPAEAEPSASAELRAAQEVARVAVEGARALGEASARAEEETARAQEELAANQARRRAGSSPPGGGAGDDADWRALVDKAKQAAAEDERWERAVAEAKQRADEVEPTEPTPRVEAEASGVIASEIDLSRSGEIPVAAAPIADRVPEGPSIVVALDDAPASLAEVVVPDPAAPVEAPPAEAPPAEAAAPDPAAPAEAAPAESGDDGEDLARRPDLGSVAEAAAVLAAAATAEEAAVLARVHLEPNLPADPAATAAPALPPAPPPHDLASSPMAAQAARVAHDAGRVAGFSDDEEEFFSAGKKLERQQAPPVESFADLDDDYQPQSFWQRLRGKAAPRSGPAPRLPQRRRK